MAFNLVCLHLHCIYSWALICLLIALYFRLPSLTLFPPFLVFSHAFGVFIVMIMCSVFRLGGVRWKWFDCCEPSCRICRDNSLQTLRYSLRFGRSRTVPWLTILFLVLLISGVLSTFELRKQLGGQNEGFLQPKSSQQSILVCTMRAPVGLLKKILIYMPFHYLVAELMKLAKQAWKQGNLSWGNAFLEQQINGVPIDSHHGVRIEPLDTEGDTWKGMPTLKQILEPEEGSKEKEGEQGGSNTYT